MQKMNDLFAVETYNRPPPQSWISFLKNIFSGTIVLNDFEIAMVTKQTGNDF